jgi:tellurite resistance protein
MLFGLSTVIWLLLTVAYLAGGVRGSGTFAADREHAIYGPFAAYIPVIGILVSAHYVQYIHNVARAAVIVFVVALAFLAAQLVAHWLLGNRPVETFHPGYLLPTVAGAFIASIGLSFSGWHHAAQSAFGVGVFFWLVIGTLIFGRLFTGTPLPAPIRPALSVLVSPPAVAGIAWYIIAGGRMDTIGYLILGILLMMLLVQVLFFSEYRTLTFSPNFWAFTFPVAASTNFVIRWIDSARFPLWHTWSWLLAGIATTFVAGLATATIVTGLRHRPEPQH